MVKKSVFKPELKCQVDLLSRCISYPRSHVRHCPFIIPHIPWALHVLEILYSIPTSLHPLCLHLSRSTIISPVYAYTSLQLGLPDSRLIPFHSASILWPEQVCSSPSPASLSFYYFPLFQTPGILGPSLAPAQVSNLTSSYIPPCSMFSSSSLLWHTLPRVLCPSHLLHPTNSHICFLFSSRDPFLPPPQGKFPPRVLIAPCTYPHQSVPLVEL